MLSIVIFVAYQCFHVKLKLTPGPLHKLLLTDYQGSFCRYYQPFVNIALLEVE